MDFSSLEGTNFGPNPMRVCREKIREFTDATGMDSSRWDSAAPPGFVAAALFVVAPDLLAQLSGYSVIHGEQTFAWRKALEVESDLQVLGSVARVRERGGVFFIGFEITVTARGEPVASGTSLFLVSAVGDELQAPNAGEATPPLAEGDPGPGQKSASRRDLVRYAAATRDWNPIHWDHRSAVAAGLPGVVVHGLLQAAWALDLAARDVEGDRPLEFARIRFRNPLLTAHPVDVAMVDDGTRRTVAISDSDSQFLTAQVDLAVE